jgi:hypothetical protein
MTVYIQRKDSRFGLETVDQFETRKEGLKMVKEYRLSDPYANYYLSSRACKEWRENEKTI